MNARIAPTPIFVVGKHRSGTTGLANHLCEHSAIEGVQHEAHGGIHESGYYSHVSRRHGPLHRRAHFREFVEVLSASDYFRLAGIDKSFMLSLYPTTYSEFFERAMDEFARRRGARYWLEKTPEHTKHALRLAREHPSAKFVGIIRNVEAVVQSSLAQRSETRSARRRLFSLIRLVLGWVYYARCLEALQHRFPDRTLLVQYESFCANTREALSRICDFLDLPYEAGMETVPYSPNTSFSGSSDRRRAMTSNEQFLVSALADVFGQVPHSVWRALDGLATRLRSPPPLPDWFFKLSGPTRAFRPETSSSDAP